MAKRCVASALHLRLGLFDLRHKVGPYCLRLQALHSKASPRLGYPWAPLERHLPADASSAVLRRGWLHAVCSLPAACCMLCYMLHGPIAVRCRLHVVGCRASTASYRLHVVVVCCNSSQQRPCLFVCVFPCGHRSMMATLCGADQ